MAARGATPRRRDARRRREAHRGAERRAAEARRLRVTVEELAQRIIRDFRRDVERARFVYREVREHRWGLVVRYVIHRVLYAHEYRFVLLYAPRVPAWLSRCETAKARLRGLDIRADRGRPVYILVREAVGLARRVLRAVAGALGRVARIPVVSRLRRLVLRAWRAIDADTLYREVFLAERKYVDSLAVVVFKLVDALESVTQRDRWAGVPLAEALVAEGRVLEAVYARRGVVEDGVFRVVEPCSPYTLAGPPRVPSVFAYIARRAIDRVTRELARRARDPWQREYIAQYAKDVLNACDAESRTVFAKCLEYARYVVEHEYGSTWYARAREGLG